MALGVVCYPQQRFASRCEKESFVGRGGLYHIFDIWRIGKVEKRSALKIGWDATGEDGDGMR